MTINAELADEMTTDVIHFLQDKYPALDTFTAMEALFLEWNGAEPEDTLIPIALKPGSPVLERLEDWSERKGCEIEDAAYRVLAEFAEVALPTEAEDAQFETSYAKVQAEVEAQESLEGLPPLNEKWRLN